MAYIVSKTAQKLTQADLIEGMSVCFSDIDTNPNNIGILQSSKSIGAVSGTWTAVINNKRYYFDKEGKSLDNTHQDLYGVVVNSSEGTLDPAIDSSYRTRQNQGQGYSDNLNLNITYLKDEFAIHAMQSILRTLPNLLSIDDGTIACVASKSYKIAEAMIKQAAYGRTNDLEASGQSGTDYVAVDKTTLQTNTEKILYNIVEAIKADTESAKNIGIRISNIDKVKFDGTPTVILDSSSRATVTIQGTPSVNVANAPYVNVNNTVDTYVTNMPSVPSEPVSISGTVSVNNFPSSSNT